MIVITPCPSFREYRTTLPMFSPGRSFTLVITGLSLPNLLIVAATANWCALHIILTASGNILTIPQWVLAPVNGGTRWTIQSVQTGQSIGLVGAPREGAGLVVGDSGFARPWTIVPLASAGPAVSRLPEGIFRYDPILSL